MNQVGVHDIHTHACTRLSGLPRLQTANSMARHHDCHLRTSVFYLRIPRPSSTVLSGAERDGRAVAAPDRRGRFGDLEPHFASIHPPPADSTSHDRTFASRSFPLHLLFTSVAWLQLPRHKCRDATMNAPERYVTSHCENSLPHHHPARVYTCCGTEH